MAGNDTAALVVALSAQLDRFQKDMDNAAGIADKAASGIEDRFKKINPLADFSRSFERFRNVLTGGAIGAALTEAVNKIIELNEQTAKIGENAEAVGVSTDRFQQFRLAVVQAGGSIDQADNFLVRFSRSVAEAATGTGNLANFLRVNNINAQQFAKLPLDVQLTRYGQLLTGASTQQEKLNDLFIVGGRQAGPQMLHALESLGGGWKQIETEARNAGTVLDQQFIDRARHASDQWNLIKLKFTVTSEELAVTVWDALAAAVGAVSGGITDIGKALDDLKKRQPGGGLPLPEPGRGPMLGERGFLPRQAPQQNGAQSVDEAGFLQNQGVPLPKPRPDFEGDAEKTKQYNAQADAIDKLTKAQEGRIELLNAERDTIGQTVYQTSYLTEKIKLEAEARKLNNGQKLSPDQLSAIDAEAQKIARATQELDDHKRAWAGVNSAIQFAGDQAIDVMDGLRNKTLTASQAVTQLANAFIHAAEQALLLGSGPLANILGTQSAIPNATGGRLGSITELVQ